MRNRIIVLISIFSIGYGVCFAQQIQHPDSVKVSVSYTKLNENTVTSRGFFSRFGGDMFSQLTAVFHMSLKNTLWVGGGLLVTGALLASDQGTYNTVRRTRENNPWMKKVSPYISQFGSYYGISVIGAFAGFGFIAHDNKALETSYMAFESFIESGIWTRVLKLVAARERPSAANIYSHESGGEWWGIFQEFNKSKRGRSVSSFDAFPSGHTASAFSIATVIANQYNSTLIVPILSYSVASLVGIARIVDDTHWASDVFVGAVIGYLTSKQILDSNPSEESRGNESVGKNKSLKDHFSWNIDPIEKTLTLAYKF